MDKQVIEISAEGDSHTDKVGFLEGLGCYLLWGVMPLYWKLLSAVPALEVLAWRMVWSCAFVLVLCVLVRRTKFLYLFRDPRAVRTFLVAGLIITCNWGVYVWAATSGHVLETSIGYYLCPLCSIALGLLVFKERLTPMQKVATVLAAVGVGYFMMAHGGQIWIAFALALTFGVYGAVKKRGGYPALPGMAFESLLTGVIGVAALLVGAVAPWIWQVAPPTPDPLAVKDPVAVMAPARWLRIAHGRPAAVVRGCRQPRVHDGDRLHPVRQPHHCAGAGRDLLQRGIHRGAWRVLCAHLAGHSCRCRGGRA